MTSFHDQFRDGLPSPERRARLARTIFDLLRDARSTGHVDPALDALQLIGYPLDRAERAVRPYVEPVVEALLLLRVEDRVKAASMAMTRAGADGLDPEARPLAWMLMKVEAVLQVARARVHDLEGGLAAFDSEIAHSVESAEAIVDRIRTRLINSDEPRQYVVRDGQGDGVLTARPSSLYGILEQSVVLEGDWLGDASFCWHGTSRCELTGEIGHHRVIIPATEPDCVDDAAHDWQAPYASVWGRPRGSGLWDEDGITREACVRCGHFRVTNVRADDGRGGHYERVSYLEPSDASRRWAASRRRATGTDE